MPTKATNRPRKGAVSTAMREGIQGGLVGWRDGQLTERRHLFGLGSQGDEDGGSPCGQAVDEEEREVGQGNAAGSLNLASPAAGHCGRGGGGARRFARIHGRWVMGGCR